MTTAPASPADADNAHKTIENGFWRRFWAVFLIATLGVGMIIDRTSFVPTPNHAKVFQNAEAAGLDAGVPDGTQFWNPETGRLSTAIADLSNMALLIGDSQSGGAVGVRGDQTWTQLALSSLGYKVAFYGRGGTGFVASTSRAMNYRDSLERSAWALPYGKNPRKPGPLIVVQGGGNDATQRASDEAILTNARELIADLRADFPKSHIVMIGTLAKSSEAGGGRRNAINGLLAKFAEKEQVPFISVGDWISRYQLTGQLADGVHLTAAGHRALVEPLRQEFEALGVTGPKN
ncbi:SGNH/GDSL hydrolase family protein [Acaricomes phytoseiuli]|uniref:SGNH/GDSL hydrolase family protein n=1 Tax=Acaricomes phytoseiuli TaxID=291968 RepID=UPI0003AACACF|nr:SGNH/GDSL hydrolase family protein [Acaricomes phytoseiuli]